MGSAQPPQPTQPVRPQRTDDTRGGDVVNVIALLVVIMTRLWPIDPPPRRRASPYYEPVPPLSDQQGEEDEEEEVIVVPSLGSNSGRAGRRAGQASARGPFLVRSTCTLHCCAVPSCTVYSRRLCSNVCILTIAAASAEEREAMESSALLGVPDTSASIPAAIPGADTYGGRRTSSSSSYQPASRPGSRGTAPAVAAAHSRVFLTGQPTRGNLYYCF